MRRYILLALLTLLVVVVGSAVFGGIDDDVPVPDTLGSSICDTC